jgi:hypothetical protein
MATLQLKSVQEEWIPVQKTAVTYILAIIISTSFYTFPFLMAIAMTNNVCGVKKWPKSTQATFFLSLIWMQFLAQLQITSIPWLIALNFFLWITFSCYTKTVTEQVAILLYIQNLESIGFYCENWSIFQFGDMYWLNSYIFTHSNNIRHADLLREMKLYEINCVFFFFHPIN